MSLFSTAYTGTAKPRQIANCTAVAAVIVLSALLAGCSAFALPFGPRAARVSMDYTATIPAKGSSLEMVDPSDWEAIRRSIAPVPTNQARIVDWANPDTRSTGSISVGLAQDGNILNICRNFATTVSDAHGVRLYRGQACRDIAGRWQLKGVSGDDAILS